MDQIQINLNKTLNSFEGGLNVAGYVPIVSTFSGALRINYGKLEVIGAIVAAVLITARALFLVNTSDRDRELKRALDVFTCYTLHGIANIFRGILETIPLISLVTCLPYDLYGKRFAYPVSSHALENQPLFGEQFV